MFYCGYVDNLGDNLQVETLAMDTECGCVVE